MILSSPSPPSIPAPKPTPLFPNGLPFFSKSVDGSRANTKHAKPPPTTYANKASTPPKKRELVEHILFVYSSHVMKSPLSPDEWKMVDDSIMEKMASQDPGDPLVVRIANSGYDKAHKCGFIACRDLDSQNWCKAVVRGIHDSSGSARRMAYRAWAKGEQPETRTCRLFFPSRFDKLTEETLIILLKKHNSPLQRGDLKLNNVEEVQGGRAVFLELDPYAFSYVKSNHHKVEFMMMDIDCQPYIPASSGASSGRGIPGVTKLTKLNPTDVTPRIAPTLKPSSSDPRLNRQTNTSNNANPASTPMTPNPPTSDPNTEANKRARDESDKQGIDGSKRRETNQANTKNKSKKK